jgi:hypothetical protein
VPAAVEADPGGGALGLGSEKGALTKGFHPFSAEYRSTKLGEHRPSLRRGEVAPAVAEVDPGTGALGLGSEKGALTKGFRPFSDENRLTKLAAACSGYLIGVCRNIYRQNR